MTLPTSRRRAARVFRSCVLVLSTFAAYCGSSTAPSTSTPPPAVPVANVSGSWSGTLSSSNFPDHTITLSVVQGGNCVDGSWTSSSQDWTGAISGLAGADSYAGQMSIEVVVGGTRCSGVGNVSGAVGADTISWTGTGFSPVGQCGIALPQTIVVTLHRS